MAKTVTAKNIPNAEAKMLANMYTAEGAKVTIKDNGNGTSDVTATWPDGKLTIADD
jgi:hypothetical protein